MVLLLRVLYARGASIVTLPENGSARSHRQLAPVAYSMPPSPEELRRRAECAQMRREVNEQERQDAAKNLMQQVEASWERADKAVDAKRIQMFATAREVVAGWEVKQKAATDRNIKSDAQHAKRMSDMWEVKQARLDRHRRRVEAETERRAVELASSQASAGARFKEEKMETIARLEAAQALAEKRRLAKEREKRRQLEERAEAADRKAEEMWQARLRVEIEARERAKEIDIICKEKEKRAEACLEKRREKIKTWRESEIIFNPW